MKKLSLPKQDIILLDINPSVVNMTIKYLKLLGVPVYAETTVFDSSYPYLYFCSNSEKISQTSAVGSERFKANTAEEFIQYFTGEKTIFESIYIGHINNEYNVHIINEKGDIKVGCQTIEFDKLFEIYANCVTVRNNVYKK